MKSVKILHLSDVHIGAKLGFLDSANSRYRQDEILSSLIKATDLCKKDKIDLLLIAGDLFDSGNIKKENISTVNNAFRSIPDTRVFISLGNHDFTALNAVFLNKAPDNVYVFDSRWECITIEEKKTRVYGRSFSKTYEDKSFLEDFNFEVSDEFINIMVMHGDLVSEGSKSLYNPITEQQLSSTNMDYIALGHIHKGSKIQKRGLTSFAYSGSPEGLNFDEVGDKGVYVGEILKHNCDLSLVPISERKISEEAIDVSDCELTEDILNKIVDTLEEKFGSGFSKGMYRIILTGNTDLNINTDVLKLKLDDRVFCSTIKDKTTLDVNMELLSTENSPEGIFARKMLEYFSQYDDSEIAQKAFRVGLQALKGEEFSIEN